MAKLKKSPATWLRENRWSIVILALAVLIFTGLYLWARPEAAELPRGEDYAEYELGKVKKILTDSTEIDPISDGACRGEQLLLVEVTSGQYAGMELQVYNYASPTYGVPVEEGDGVSLLISTYADGTIRASVFEYNREWAVYLMFALFLVVTVAIGGKTGAKSLLGLVLTVGVLFFIEFPMLLKGAPLIPTTFFLCSLVAVVCFIFLGGVTKKTVCACFGTILGMALAMAMGLFAQAICRVDGLRMEDAEALLQIRQTGTPLGLRGLLVSGVIVSTLGAVMDVAMSLSSSLWEVHSVDPQLTPRRLFHSGMNIGRDMVGTMTNTLILALLGGSFVFILYLYTMDLSFHQLMTSSYLSLEVISGIASSIGVILAVPITAAVASWLYGRKA